MVNMADLLNIGMLIYLLRGCKHAHMLSIQVKAPLCPECSLTELRTWQGEINHSCRGFDYIILARQQLFLIKNKLHSGSDTICSPGQTQIRLSKLGSAAKLWIIL